MKYEWSKTSDSGVFNARYSMYHRGLYFSLHVYTVVQDLVRVTLCWSSPNNKNGWTRYEQSKWVSRREKITTKDVERIHNESKIWALENFILTDLEAIEYALEGYDER